MNEFNKSKPSRVSVMQNFVFMLLVSFLSSIIIGPIFVSLSMVMIIAMVLCVIAVFVLSLFQNKILNYIVTYVTASVFGVSMYSSILFYIGALGSDLVALVLAVCFIVFGLCAVIGYKSNYDFSSWGNILGFALLGLIIFSVVSIFLFPGNFIMMVSGGIGVAIFIGYTIYDFSLLSDSDFEEHEVPIMAFSIYLNLLNLILQALKMVYYLVAFLKE